MIAGKGPPKAGSFAGQNEVQSRQPAPRKPVFVADTEAIEEDAADPFTPDIDPADGEALDALTPDIARPRRHGLSLSKLTLTTFGLIFATAFGLWVGGLIQSFFERADWLGWTMTALVAIGSASLAVIVIREIAALFLLNSVQSLRERAEEAVQEKKPAKARVVVSRLQNLLSARPETAGHRARFAAYDNDIIDGPHLVDLAETELLLPLDRQARTLILSASKRVSLVTAISPQALVGIGYVLFEATRLIRQLSFLYGGRPGTFGTMRLSGDVIAHLAVTGSLAASDGFVQQLVGEGVANRLSAKLGEGVVNGLMTARVGIAAMDLCRPLPFRATKRPGISEFVGDLTRQVTGMAEKDAKN